ncbi:hypothetical protein [Paenibacillus jamilae]|nr:hypothetical protein [Paenibacillus jamilae]
MRYGLIMIGMGIRSNGSMSIFIAVMVVPGIIDDLPIDHALTL